MEPIIKKTTTLYNITDDFSNAYERVCVMPVDEYNPADYMEYEIQPLYITWIHANKTVYELQYPAIKMINKDNPKDCALIMDDAINELLQHRQSSCICMQNVISYLGSPYNPQELQDEIAYWDAWNDADELLANLKRADGLIERFEEEARWNPNFNGLDEARAELEAIGDAPDLGAADDPDYIKMCADEIYDYVQAVENWFDSLDY